MPETQSETLAAFLNDVAAPMKLRLFKSAPPTDVASVLLADIVECDFAGYAAITLDDFDEVEEADELVGEVLPNPRSFVASDALAAVQIVYGVYCTRHPVGNPVQLMAYKVFDPPISVVAPGQEIEATVRVQGLGL